MGDAQETIAFRMTLSPGQATEYRRRHDEIWPALTRLLLEAGVIDYRIFLDPTTNALFAVLTRTMSHGMDALPETDVMKRWWDMMADIMDTHADNAPIQVPLEPMFHLAVGDS